MISVFYSFKGGVGRSMAVANVADLLARRRLKVLMIDFDMEAPGLEQYFPINQSETRNHQGLLDLLLCYKQTVSLAATNEGPSFKEIERFIVEVYKDLPSPAKLHLMPAGQRDGSPDKLAEYAHNLRTFDWQDFISNWGGDRFFEWLRRRVLELYDVVLIDSRTGVTEMGGICAYQLADSILMFSGANLQNIEGTENLVRNFAQPGVQLLRQYRPLDVVVVPARIEQGDRKLLEDLRKRFAVAFDHCTPPALLGAKMGFWDLKIPYEPHYAFKERVVTDPNKAEVERPIARSFRKIVRCLSLLAESGSALARLGKTSARGATAPEVIHYDPTRRLAGFDACILYNEADRRAVGAIAQHLENQAGLRIWTDWITAAGANRGAQLEEALLNANCIVVAVSDAGVRGQLLEEVNFVISAAATRMDIRLIAVILPQTENPAPQMPRRLQESGVMDFRISYEACLQDLVDRIRDVRVAPPAEKPSVDFGEPYVGLQPLTEQQAMFFTGRDAALVTVRDRVRVSKFIALIGPPGCGKSSLVHAGLFPAMRADEETHWDLHFLRLREIPQQATEAFVQIFEATQAGRANARKIDTAGDPGQIADSILRSLNARSDNAKSTRALIFIDQFEELAGTREDSKLAQVLTAAAQVADSRLTILVAIRDDALPGLKAKYPALGALIEEHHIALQPMSQEELQQAIEEPARRAGYTFEPGLVNRIVRDFSADTRPLALLQMVLQKLYREARDGRLTNSAYDQLGGLAGFLERQAEDLFAQFSSEEREAALWLLLRLVQTDGHGNSTRRVARVREFSNQSIPQPVIDSALAKLTEARLIIRSTIAGEAMVELASETLLQSWGRLQAAIAESRADLMLRAEIQTITQIGQGTLPDAVIQRTSHALSNTRSRNVLSDLEVNYFKMSLRVRLYRRTVAAIAALLLLGALGWYAYTLTPRYQITKVIADAPVIDVALGRGAEDSGPNSGVPTAVRWIQTLRSAGKTSEANRAFDFAWRAIKTIDLGSKWKLNEALALAGLAVAAEKEKGASLLHEAEALIEEAKPVAAIVGDRKETYLSQQPPPQQQQQQQQQEPLPITRQVGDVEERTRLRQLVIGEVALGWVAIGEVEKATAKLDQIPPGLPKVAIADAIASRSTLRQQAHLLPTITEDLKTIADPLDRVSATLQWTRTVNAYGSREQVISILEAAENDISNIAEPSTRIPLSIVLIQAGSKPGFRSTESIFKRSQLDAAAMPDPEKLRYLTLLAEGATGAVPEASINAVWKMVVDLGTSMPPTNETSSFLSLARRRLAQEAEPKRSVAEQTAARVSEARKIADPLLRTTELIRISEEQLQAADRHGAKSTLDRALDSADRIQNPAAPTQLLARIARGYSELGAYRQSRLIANRCTSPIDRLNVYTNIIARYFSPPVKIQPSPD